MELTLGSRFAVFFFGGGVIPNPIDIRFQRVSGLSGTVEMTAVNEGGQNLYTHRMPKRVGYGSLLLERGMMLRSPLGLEFNAAMTFFEFRPSNVTVTLLDADNTPTAAWLFIKAFPQRWATADLSASDDKVLIETLELAYTRMQVLRI